MEKLLCLCAALAAFVAAAAPATGVHIGLELPPGPNNPRNSEGAFMPLKDGRIMFAYSRYYGKSSSDHATAEIAARYSSDKGRTWTNVKNLEDDPDGWFCYIALQPLNDGTALLGYCAYKGLAHSRIVKVPVEWFYK